MPDLSGNAALDVLIGLAFVYLLFSLLCSAIQETIAGWLDLRANTLVEGLRTLLNQDNPGSAPAAQRAAATGAAAAGVANLQDLQEALYEHPLVAGLYNEERRLGRNRNGPSYLPPRTFAIALLDLLAPQSPDSDPLADLTNIRNEIEQANLPAGTKQALLAIANQVGTSRDKLRKGIEDWFNGSMARVSGWYKRKAQVWLCVIAFVVTIGFNVDTVVIGERLMKDESLRVAVAQQGVTAAQGSAPAAGQGSAPAAGTPTAGSIDERLEEINKQKKLGLPLGHTKEAKGLNHIKAADIPEKLIGLGLSFIMLSLGAPFWFDTLSKLARLRNTGAPEKPQDTAPTADG